MVWTKAQFGNDVIKTKVCFKRGKCFACGKGRGKRQEDKRTGQKMEAENYI